MQRHTGISFSRRVRRTGIPNTEVKIFMKTRFYFSSELWVHCDFWFSENLKLDWHSSQDQLQVTQIWYWSSLTTLWSNKHKGKNIWKIKMFIQRKKSAMRADHREGCNHSELLIYPNLNLMNKELITFLKPIFLIRCANKQNISDFI